ncbi:YbaN family protein [Azonexus sp.]|uniref:YbaN family protein n=1 Tax=Azonexus sp. TaxID=1872668 RepID=UPI0039E3D221
MKKPVYRALGAASALLGLVGAFLPLLPTTPFLILAAYFWGRSHPEWEARLLAHPVFGSMILAWRTRGAIPLLGKCLATAMLALSALSGWVHLPGDWRYLPALLGAAILLWLWLRPSR